MFESIHTIFERNFSERQELGASVSVWQNDEEILSLSQGWTSKEKKKPWTQDTLVPVYSATKGPAAATLLLVLDQEGLSLETKIQSIWPSFPIVEANIGDILSHRCGLAALDQKVSLWNFDAVVNAIEQQEPNWTFGDTHGYHPRTYGFLLDQLVRIICQQPLGQMWRTLIAEPLDLDFWIGLPEDKYDQVATLYTGKMDKSDLENDFYKALNSEETLQRKAFASPRGLQAIREMNEPKAWSLGLPAMGGIGTASALAQFYQATLGNTYPEIFPHRMRETMSQRRSNGYDQTLMRDTAFSCGFMMDALDESQQKVRELFGPNISAFGHPGAGGSHAFADPKTGISFAYTMNQMELSVLPGSKSLDMVKALYND